MLDDNVKNDAAVTSPQNQEETIEQAPAQSEPEEKSKLQGSAVIEPPKFDSPEVSESQNIEEEPSIAEVEQQISNSQEQVQEQENLNQTEEVQPKKRRKKSLLRRMAEVILGKKFAAKLSGEVLRDVRSVGDIMSNKGISFGGSLSKEKTGSLVARSTIISSGGQSEVKK